MDHRRGDRIGRCRHAPPLAEGASEPLAPRWPYPREMGRLRVALLLAGALALLPVPAAAAATPGSGTSGTESRDVVRPFSLVLGQRADFVPQANFVQCVGASMQMMINMIEPGRDRSSGTQLRLQNLARSWSGPRPARLPAQGRERERLGDGAHAHGRRAVQAGRDHLAPGGASHGRHRRSVRPASRSGCWCGADDTRGS